MLRRLLARIRRVEPTQEDDIVSQQAAVLAAGGEPTRSVVLRLDPHALDYADLQVRWDIERRLRAVHPELLFVEDGYGFARSSDAMLLSYATHEPERLVEALIEALAHDARIGSRLEKAVLLAIGPRDGADKPGEEYANHRVVYPPREAGKPVPD